MGSFDFDESAVRRVHSGPMQPRCGRCMLLGGARDPIDSGGTQGVIRVRGESRPARSRGARCAVRLGCARCASETHAWYGSFASCVALGVFIACWLACHAARRTCARAYTYTHTHGRHGAHARRVDVARAPHVRASRDTVRPHARREPNTDGRHMWRAFSSDRVSDAGPVRSAYVRTAASKIRRGATASGIPLDFNATLVRLAVTASLIRRISQRATYGS